MKDRELLKSLSSPASGGLIYSLASLAPTVLALIFAVVLAILLSCGVIGEEYASSDWYIYCSYLISQIAFVGIALFAKNFFAVPIKQIYRPTKIKYFAVAIAAQFGLFSLSFVNSYFIAFLQWLGLNYSGDVLLPSLDGGKIVLAIIVIALLPAVMEETIFRSLMLTSQKKFGTVWCVLISGALFSLVHHSPAQTVYQFICGCVFALIAIRSGSVLPTVLSHFLNNTFVLIMCKIGYGDIAFPVAFYIASGAAFLLSLVYLIFIDKNGNEKGGKGNGMFFAFAAVGIAFNAAMWIMELFVQ